MHASHRRSRAAALPTAPRGRPPHGDHPMAPRGSPPCGDPRAGGAELRCQAEQELSRPCKTLPWGVQASRERETGPRCTLVRCTLECHALARHPRTPRPRALHCWAVTGLRSLPPLILPTLRAEDSKQRCRAKQGPPLSSQPARRMLFSKHGVSWPAFPRPRRRQADTPALPSRAPQPSLARLRQD